MRARKLSEALFTQRLSEQIKIQPQLLFKVFEPWMKRAEGRKLEGLRKPISLVEACEILGDSKNLQDEAEAKLRVLEEAAASSQKMTSHQVRDNTRSARSTVMVIAVNCMMMLERTKHPVLCEKLALFHFSLLSSPSPQSLIPNPGDWG